MVNIILQGVQTEGRLPVDAILQMQVAAGSLLGGSTNYGPVPFGSVKAAGDSAPAVLTAASFKAAELFSANARLQNMMGQVNCKKM